MHEYSIVAALVERVHEEARARRRLPGQAAARPDRRARSGVDVPLLVTAYETFRERTICEQAELVIDAVETRWTCPRCSELIVPGDALALSRLPASRRD